MLLPPRRSLSRAVPKRPPPHVLLSVASPRAHVALPPAPFLSWTDAPCPREPAGGLHLAGDRRSRPLHRRHCPASRSSVSHQGSSEEEDEAQLAPSPCAWAHSVSCSRPGPALASMDKWRRTHVSTLSLIKSVFHFFFGRGCVFLSGKRIFRKGAFYFSC